MNTSCTLECEINSHNFNMNEEIAMTIEKISAAAIANVG
jgi:hypothetical protein